MTNSSSVSKRFAISVGTNLLRALLGFLTGMLVARGLKPAGYGDLTFLLGSFVAIRSLLDMGTSNAFFTFISQRQRGRRFYLLYAAWLAFQFLLSVLMVAIILPDSLIARVWLGNAREIILVALVAAFMQQQVWLTISQLGESTRQTVKVQGMGLLVVTAHFIAVLVLMTCNWLSAVFILIAIICEYVIAVAITILLLKKDTSETDEKPSDSSFKETISEYWIFCRPLILLSLFSFLYEFADRWLLQRFGGAAQQGYYQISAQFATVSLLATTSILNILWKEIAEANDRGNKERVAIIYSKVSRGLLMLGAVISCFLVPWSEQIVGTMLGSAYKDAWPVLAIMFMYPIHQSMGQVNCTMFMACGQTKAYMFVGIIGMVISMPVSYVLLAPSSIPYIGGMHLGALGMAIKMVGINVLSVNIQAWMIARYHGWCYEWKYQVAGISSVLALGYLVKISVWSIAGDVTGEMGKLKLSGTLLVSGGIYSAAVICLIWLFPTMAGVDHQEIRLFLNKCRSVVRI